MPSSTERRSVTTEGFSGYPEWTPNFNSRLTISLDVETHSRPNEELGIWETTPSGRRRMVVEGEAEFVEAIYAATKPAIDTASAEIGS